MYGYLLGKEDCVLIWKAGDVTDLRTNHRIVGHLVGSLPNNSKQNNEFGLPLVLMPEEAKLLIELDVLSLRDINIIIQSLSQSELDQLRMLTTNQCSVAANEPGNISTTPSLVSIHTEYPLDSLRVIIDSRLNTTCNTAESTSTSTTTNNTASTESMSTSITIGSESMSTSTTTGTRGTARYGITTTVDDSRYQEVEREEEEDVGRGDVTHSWVWPQTEEQVYRYRIFKDLWYKGYYLTSGLKFGGDYLVYEGDPLTCHASFIAKVVSWERDSLPINRLVTAGRLGGKVKKQTLLCSINPVGGLIRYITSSWTGGGMRRE